MSKEMDLDLIKQNSQVCFPAFHHFCFTFPKQHLSVFAYNCLYNWFSGGENNFRPDQAR